MTNFLKKRSFVLLGSALALGFATAVFASPPADSPYMEDVQNSYSQDPAQNTFQDVGMISCMISKMRPEYHVGTGAYVAVVDQNKCDKTVNSGSSSSNGSTSDNHLYVTAILTPTRNADNSIDIRGSLSVPADPSKTGNDGKQKNIQIHATVWGNKNLYAPYGKWNMDFCSSLYPDVGTCSDGKGHITVDTSGITLYEGGSGGSGAGVTVYTSSNGSTGYGVVLNTNSDGSTQGGKFRFDNSYYLYNQTTPSNSQICYDPSATNSSVRFSTWQNNLYDQSTGQRIAYQNPGFFISAHGTSHQIGEMSYSGLNFWSNDTADELASTTVDGPDGTVYTVHRAPGTLRKVTTVTTNMNALDGININYSFWGNTNNTVGLIQSYCSASGTNCPSLSTSNNNINLTGTWSSSTGQFTFTGFVDYSNNGAVTNFSSPVVKAMTDIQTLGANNMNGWVNGANANYSAQLNHWVSGSGNQAYAVSAIPVTLQSSVIVPPQDPSLNNLALYCTDNCPSLSSGHLGADVSPTTWPPTTTTNLIWNSSLGAPVFASATSVAVDWTPSSINSSKQGHWYQLYPQADLSLLNCGYYDNTNHQNHDSGAYCSQQVTSPTSGSTTYYTWQTGGQWDSYAYLTDPSGNTPQVNPPINLSYTVPNVTGNAATYVGHQIVIQSPEPGNLWLPGHCIDANGAPAQCNSNNQWINDVFIPFAQDATGTVGLLNANGAATGTSYYAKWIERGVMFKALDLGKCSALDLSIVSGVSLPTAANVDPTVAQQTWPALTDFQVKPTVKDGDEAQ
jgi:hypothetical protein